MAAEFKQFHGCNNLIVSNDEPDNASSLSEQATESSRLVITAGGDALLSIDGQEFPTRTGDLLIIPSHSRYQVIRRNTLVGFQFTWNEEGEGIPHDQLKSIPGYMAMFVLEPIYRMLHGVEKTLYLETGFLENVLEIQDAIREELDNRESGFRIAVNSLFLQLVIKLSRYYTKNDDPERQALLRLGIVIQAMEQETSRHWTVEDFSNLAGMSESTLFRLFREATGYTPIEYLIRIRLQYCMEELTGTDKPINDIAHEAGFRDGNYFSRQFRKHTGMSPREFRKHHKETQQD